MIIEELSWTEARRRIAAPPVLVVTATLVETQAVHACLDPLPICKKVAKTASGERVYYIGMIGRYIVVHLQCADLGSISAGGSMNTVHGAAADWSPCCIIMPGIAFGVKQDDQKIGDVLIAETFIPYQIVRVGAKTTIHRGKQIQGNSLLLSRFKDAEGWKNELPGGMQTRCIFGAMLTGEALIDNIEERDRLVAEFKTTVGGEMEGGGVYSAAQSCGIPAIVAKGICDFADGKKKEDKENRQRIASRASVELCRHILSAETFIQGAAFTDILARAPRPIDVLFDIYNPGLKPYYVHREQDSRFSSAIISGSVWVSGKSGMGKTTLIRFGLGLRNIYYVGLESCGGGSVIQMLSHLNYEINLKIKNGRPYLAFTDVHEGIRTIVESLGSNEIGLVYIDEIPVNQQNSGEFVLAIYAIIVGSAARKETRTQFVLSSLFSPRQHLKEEHQKAHEVIRFLDCENWEEEDLNQIIQISLKNMGGPILAEGERSEMILAANGSPRFVKEYLRRRMESISSTHSSVMQSTSRDIGVAR